MSNPESKCLVPVFTSPDDDADLKMTIVKELLSSGWFRRECNHPEDAEAAKKTQWRGRTRAPSIPTTW